MDYEKLGLKIGLEIHQQLDTGKLFCSCPCLIREDSPDFTVKRKLRASAGESGEIDIAAKHEMLKELNIIYEGYKDTTCLVELDEEPPHKVNQKALETALQISMMLKSKILDAIQVMRKTVVDGSNTSGFQRTMLVAKDGKIDNIRIETVCLEEDAARIIKQEKDQSIYRLDRLGIPLIEIATAPDIKTPEQSKEVAEKIGLLLRSTGKVMRGLGTIRQDVNVSIKEGERIEIKGAQDLKMIPKLVENEILRQQNLIEIKNELEKRKAQKNPKNKITDLTKLLINTKCKFAAEAIKKGSKVYGIKLNKFEGLLKKEKSANQRLGYEFSTFSKLLGFGGVIHSDEDLNKYNFDENEIKSIKKEIDMKELDAFVMCIGDESKLKSLFENYVIPRADYCFAGVPREVRKANDDGSTTYLRPIPGASRMYPETDIPLIIPNTKNIAMPELIEDKAKKYEKLGLSKDLALLIAKEKADLFEMLVSKFSSIKAGFVAETILPKLLEIRRKYNVDVEKINENDWMQIFELVDSMIIAKDAIPEIIIGIANGKTAEQVVNEKKLKILSDKEIEDEIKRIAKTSKNVLADSMNTLKIKADAQAIMKILKKLGY